MGLWLGNFKEQISEKSLFVRRLIESYPEEAQKARTVAPAFTRDALKTISKLEEQVLKLQPFQ